MRATSYILLLMGCLSLEAGSQPASPGATAAHLAIQQPGLKQRAPEAPGTKTESGLKTHSITLDVVVDDAAGNPVGGLARGDFTLLDTGHPRTVTSFQEMNRAAAPTDAEAILLVDTMSNSFASIAMERDQIEKFLGLDGGSLSLPISIVLLSDSGARIVQPTRDGNVLIAELKKTSTAIPTIKAAMGGAGSIERFQRSLKALNQLMAYEGTKPGRKLLLWIGPGWPMLSSARFSSSERDQYADWQGIVDFSTYLRQARMTLYSVETLSSETSVSHAVYYQDFLHPVTGPKNASSANLALPVLALQSGGRVVNGSNDLVAEIASCLQDAKAYYTLSFDAPKSDRPDEYRTLEVKIAKPGLTARTNSGYYAQPGSF